MTEGISVSSPEKSEAVNQPSNTHPSFSGSAGGSIAAPASAVIGAISVPPFVTNVSVYDLAPHATAPNDRSTSNKTLTMTNHVLRTGFFITLLSLSF